MRNLLYVVFSAFLFLVMMYLRQVIKIKTCRGEWYKAIQSDFFLGNRLKNKMYATHIFLEG